MTRSGQHPETAAPHFAAANEVKPRLRTNKSAGESASYLTILAIIANGGLLVLLVVMLVENGPPSSRELLLVVALFATPMLSLLALLRPGGDSIIGLWFKRKRLEEEARIGALLMQRHMAEPGRSHANKI